MPITHSIWSLFHLGPTRCPQEILKVLGFHVLQLKVLKILTEHLQRYTKGVHMFQGTIRSPGYWREPVTMEITFQNCPGPKEPNSSDPGSFCLSQAHTRTITAALPTFPIGRNKSACSRNKSTCEQAGNTESDVEWHMEQTELQKPGLTDCQQVMTPGRGAGTSHRRHNSLMLRAHKKEFRCQVSASWIQRLKVFIFSLHSYI